MLRKISIGVLAFFILHCNNNKAAIENTHWKLVWINGQAVTAPANSREIYMELTPGDPKET